MTPALKKAKAIKHLHSFLSESFILRLVLVIAPDLPVAQSLAKLILEKRLAACVNLLPGVESHYWWQGKLEMSAEVLMLIKTSEERFEALRELVELHHPYKCPEIVALKTEEISPIYRQWWEGSLAIDLQKTRQAV